MPGWAGGSLVHSAVRRARLRPAWTICLVTCWFGLASPAAVRSSVYPAVPDWSSGPASIQGSLATGDVDRDGDLDLVCGNYNQSTGLFLNTGRVFAQTPAWSSDSLSTTESIALGDVDRDGDLDLVCGNLGRVSTLYRNEGAQLPTSPSWATAAPRSTKDVALADMDGDGDLDLVLANRGEACEWYENQAGSFAAEAAWTAGQIDSSSCLAIGDVDGDGSLDLVSGNVGRSARPLTLYRNGSRGLELTPSWASRQTWNARAVALGDVDGDGRLDLVCGTDDQGVALYRNDGGVFAPEPIWTAGSERFVESLALGDVDGDADLDLVVGRMDQGNALYLNTGDGFADLPDWRSPATDRTWSVVLADVNGDGALDLLCGNSQQSQTLYLNAGVVLAEAPSWISAPDGRFTDLALGDADGDGDPDIFAGNLDAGNALFANEAGRFAAAPTWRSGRIDRTLSVALDDIDGDRLPDLVCGNGHGASAYLNPAESFPDGPSWVLDTPDSTTAVALADIDGDGDPDLVCGTTGERGGQSKAYLNLGGTLATEPAWTSDRASYTWAIELQDVDNDSDPDLVLGNQNQSSTLYRNQAGIFTRDPVWSASAIAFTTSLDLGDLDGDGDPDLVCGNGLNSTTAYANDGATFSPDPVWSSAEAPLTQSVALGDVDGDGDLDLVCGNSGFVAGGRTTLYRNEGGRLSIVPVWRSAATAFTRSVALADLDEDGDLDLVCGNGKPFDPEGELTIHHGRRLPPFLGDPTAPTRQLPFTTAFLRRVRVEPGGLNQQRVSFRAIDIESDPVWILAEFQFEGDPSWLPVEGPAQPGRLGPLAASPAGIEHAFTWDVSRIPRDHRNVVLRLRAISPPQRVSAIRDVATYLRPAGHLSPIRAEIVTSSESIAFPTVTVGDTVSVALEIANAGNAVLSIDAVLLPSAAIVADASVPFAISPGAVDTLTFHFAPRTAKVPEGGIEIHSNDPVSPVKRIEVSGDVRGLRIHTRLLAPGAEVPLGEAVTVIVTPAPEVRIEGGVLFHRSAGAATEFADSVTLGRSADDWIAVIPGSAIRETGLEYYIRVNNSGVAAADPSDAPARFFTQAVSLPSLISSSPKPNSTAGFLEGRPILVEVSLPQGAAFTAGTLHYRLGGEREYRATPLLAGTGSPASTIPDSCVTARGVEYWIEAATLTRTLTDPPVQAPEHPRAVTITVPDLPEPGPHPGRAYRMASIPLRFGEDFTGTIVPLLSDQAEFGPYDVTRWRAFRFDSDGGLYREVSDPGAAAWFRPAPGAGFWLIARDENRITTAPVPGFSVPTDSAAAIRLRPGWNQVGHPYLFPVAWEETAIGGVGSVLDHADQIEPPVAWSPDAGYRLDVELLQPFEGYWVKNLTGSDLIWQIPAREALARKAPPAADAAPEPGAAAGGDGSWSIRLIASAGGALDADNWVGARPGADACWDAADRSDPPLPPGRVMTLRFPRPDWPTHPGWYGSDIRACNAPGSAPGMPANLDLAEGWGETWPFDLVLQDPAAPHLEAVMLTLVRAGELPSGATLCLVDREQGTTSTPEWNRPIEVAVRTVRGEPWPDGARFSLLVGDASYLERETPAGGGAPARTFLSAPWPNPASRVALCAYGLARAGSVDLAVFDPEGSRVRQLETGFRPAGTYRALWNGIDASGRPAASGVYYLRLQAPGASLSRATVWVR